MISAHSGAAQHAFGASSRFLAGARALFAAGMQGRKQALQLGGGRELQLSGKLDKHAALELKAALKELAPTDVPGFIIDLADVQSWTCEGLASLVHALDVAELAGKSLTLVDAPDGLRQVLERAQLHHLFSIIRRDELGR